MGATRANMIAPAASLLKRGSPHALPRQSVLADHVVDVENRLAGQSPYAKIRRIPPRCKARITYRWVILLRVSRDGKNRELTPRKRYAALIRAIPAVAVFPICPDAWRSAGACDSYLHPVASWVPSQRYRQQRVEMTAVADHKPLGEPQTATFVANPVEVDTGRE